MIFILKIINQNIYHYKKQVNLIYYNDKSLNGNFGDELSKFITNSLINKEKYELFYNTSGIKTNLVCIGSYIQAAKNNAHIFFSKNKRQKRRICISASPALPRVQ